MINLSDMLMQAMADENTFSQASRLYCESFRDNESFKAADNYYPRGLLVEYLLTPVTCPDGEILKNGYSIEFANSIVDSLEFVELCNYKGEGEGFELLDRVRHLRIFVSKHQYI